MHQIFWCGCQITGAGHPRGLPCEQPRYGRVRIAGTGYPRGPLSISVTTVQAGPVSGQRLWVRIAAQLTGSVRLQQESKNESAVQIHASMVMTGFMTSMATAFCCQTAQSALPAQAVHERQLRFSSGLVKNSRLSCCAAFAVERKGFVAGWHKWPQSGPLSRCYW